MKLKTFFWLLMLACLWGPAFLFIKIAVQDIPPLTLVATRVLIAASLLYLILKAQGRSLPRFGPIWKHFAVTGLLLCALPYVLLSWGEQYIDSSLAAILIGLTPVFTLLTAHVFTTDECLTPGKLVGIGLGFAGLLALVGPALLGGVQATLWGLLAGTVAAASYGVSMVYARQTLRGLPPLVAPTAQLLSASAFLLPLSLLIERPYHLPMPGWAATSSLLLLAVFGTALAFVLYYRLQEQASATVMSMVTYLIPIVATIVGTVVGEQLGWNVYLGGGLVLMGVMSVNGLFGAAGWGRISTALTRQRRQPRLASQVK